jgi:hypothetical protein
MMIEKCSIFGWIHFFVFSRLTRLAELSSGSLSSVTLQIRRIDEENSHHKRRFVSKKILNSNKRVFFF